MEPNQCIFSFVITCCDQRASSPPFANSKIDKIMRRAGTAAGSNAVTLLLAWSCPAAAVFLLLGRLVCQACFGGLPLLTPRHISALCAFDLVLCEGVRSAGEHQTFYDHSPSQGPAPFPSLNAKHFFPQTSMSQHCFRTTACISWSPYTCSAVRAKV